MKNQINVEELKKIQIGILDYIDEFCKKNKINYWLTAGTLLGAIRHKGYIPWDDDIDVGMLREDYKKFVKLFNNENNRYQFHCFENDDKWHLTFGKVLDTTTELYEPDEKTGVKTSVFVDVFVYDNAPKDEKILNKMFKKRDLYRELNNLQVFKKFYKKEKQKYNIIRLPIHYLLNILPKRYFVKKNIKNCQLYSSKETGYVGNFTSITKMICDKKVFDSYVDVEFEGKKYPAPVGYDEWLTKFYGDYMKLPPEEKRIPHHNFVAYKVENKNEI